MDPTSKIGVFCEDMSNAQTDREKASARPRPGKMTDGKNRKNKN
jgi:hypothetical protein